MSTWDNYQEKVRTNIRVPADKELLTEKQWAKKHFVKKSNACGKKLWSNQSCQVFVLYLWSDEVRPMNADELAKYRAENRERRNFNAKVKLEKELKQVKNEVYRKAVFDVVKKTFSSVNNNSDKKYKYIVLDTETTGLNSSEDELLQISIIDNQGNTLFDEYIKPLFNKCWDNAMAINGITPDMVSDKPNIIEYKKELNSILNSTDVIVGYNTQFDLSFLSAIGIENTNAKIVDVMQDFAEVYGEWNDNDNCFKFHNLTTCAFYYGYDWNNDKAHNSLSDCRATLFCYQQLQNENIDLR